MTSFSNFLQQITGFWNCEAKILQYKFLEDYLCTNTDEDFHGASPATVK